MIDAIDRVVAGGELPVLPVHEALTDSTEAAAQHYEQGEKALEAGAWHEAIDLFSRVLKIDPSYPGVTRRMEYASHQIHLATRYRAARRALVLEQWDEAANHLDHIAELAPGYLDVAKLRTKAARREKLDAGQDEQGFDYPTQVE
jgi:tetratricopeptide (TPR) repeat protein